MPEPSERVITWAQVLPGDVIRGADGEEWTIMKIRGIPRLTVTMNNCSADDVTGHPRKDSAVTLLRAGNTRKAMDTFADAGLSAHYEGTEDT